MRTVSVARSMAHGVMGDILYGEHDSIKHSIKSSLINLTLALDGGLALGPPRGASSFIPLRIVDQCGDTRRPEAPMEGGGKTRGPSHKSHVILGTLRWRGGPLGGGEAEARSEIATTSLRGNGQFSLNYSWRDTRRAAPRED